MDPVRTGLTMTRYLAWLDGEVHDDVAEDDGIFWHDWMAMLIMLTPTRLPHGRV